MLTHPGFFTAGAPLGQQQWGSAGTSSLTNTSQMLGGWKGRLVAFADGMTTGMQGMSAQLSGPSSWGNAQMSQTSPWAGLTGMGSSGLTSGMGTGMGSLDSAYPLPSLQLEMVALGTPRLLGASSRQRHERLGKWGRERGLGSLDGRLGEHWEHGGLGERCGLGGRGAQAVGAWLRRGGIAGWGGMGNTGMGMSGLGGMGGMTGMSSAMGGMGGMPGLNSGMGGMNYGIGWSQLGVRFLECAKGTVDRWHEQHGNKWDAL